MNADDLRALLRSKGIPVGGSWDQTRPVQGALGELQDPLTDNDSRTGDKAGGSEVLSTIARQKEALRKIEQILESQLASDQKTLAELHATLARIKHGGGG